MRFAGLVVDLPAAIRAGICLRVDHPLRGSNPVRDWQACFRHRPSTLQFWVESGVGVRGTPVRLAVLRGLFRSPSRLANAADRCRRRGPRAWTAAAMDGACAEARSL